jgi:hypothetical protein
VTSLPLPKPPTLNAMQEVTSELSVLKSGPNFNGPHRTKFFLEQVQS